MDIGIMSKITLPPFPKLSSAFRDMRFDASAPILNFPRYRSLESDCGVSSWREWAGGSDSSVTGYIGTYIDRSMVRGALAFVLVDTEIVTHPSGRPARAQAWLEACSIGAWHAKNSSASDH
jgi:hypothetical protein